MTADLPARTTTTPRPGPAERLPYAARCLLCGDTVTPGGRAAENHCRCRNLGVSGDGTYFAWAGWASKATTRLLW
jgi:hypothetical protein